MRLGPLRRYGAHAPLMTAAVRAHLAKIADTQRSLLERLAAQTSLGSRETAGLAREASKHRELVREWREWQKTQAELQSVRDLQSTADGDADADEAMGELVAQEAAELQRLLAACEARIRALLVAPDADDEASAVLEVRAGTGGSEAALFAAELLLAYQRYAALRRWGFAVVHVSGETAGGEGVREATVNISGRGVFGRLKFESGVHRVQRVPRTESQGRLHTSTVTVAILPQPEEIVVEIPERDLRIDSFKSGGPGGQHVNKTNSAIRVVHLPTGISVAVQEERCAQQNRLCAMRLLQARLYEIRRCEQDAARRSARHSQIGQAERSEKIRTYNFPQTRITDHRIGVSIHDLDGFFSGRLIDSLVDQLAMRAEEERLSGLQAALPAADAHSTAQPA